jgi:aspartate racemase
MKTIGIIGGIGPESTIEYYRFMIAEYREQRPGAGNPAIIINSVDLEKLVRLVTANQLDQITEYLLSELHKLANAGAQIALLSANTPHIVFDEISRHSPIPLVSIVEATCDAAKALNLKKLGLFGTRFTMQGRFYPEVFLREGMALVIPAQDEQAYIHDIYMNQLLKGIFLPETREQLLQIVQRMKERDGIEGLILGGTELPLILRDGTAAGIPFLDTTQIHVKAIIEKALA